MKKAILILAILLAISTGLLAPMGCTACDSRTGSVTSSWSGRNMSYDVAENSWRISAGALRGRSTRMLDFTAENLAALRIDSTNSSGEVRFTIVQGNVTESIEVSDGFDQLIDTSAFAPGHISLRLDFEQVENLQITVRWA